MIVLLWIWSSSVLVPELPSHAPVSLWLTPVSFCS
jgi:hypothetical protein